MDEACPRCGSALSHDVRRPGLVDWFLRAERLGQEDHRYTCPSCGLTGGFGTTKFKPFGPRARIWQQLRRYVGFHGFRLFPRTWLLFLLVAETAAAAISAATGLAFGLTVWVVPLVGWTALKALDVMRWPSLYRRQPTRREVREQEDLLAGVAPFPLYVVPPELWKGDISLGGSGTSGERLTHLDFAYVDDAAL